MTRPPMEISRRGLLTVAAAGAVTIAVVPLSPANADTLAMQKTSPSTTPTPTTEPPTTLAELEANAMALKPPVFLLETTIPSQFKTNDKSPLSIVSDVNHTGNSSLRWDYKSRSTLSVKAPLGIVPPSGASGGNGADIGYDVNTLAFWVYQSKASSGKLRIEAGRGQRTDAWCEMNLNFTGWRTAWIRYQDMKGKARADMDTLRFVAPSSAGTLHLDQLIVNRPLRSNFPTPDRQVPFVNPGVHTDPNQHWQDLLWFSEQAAKPLPMPTPTAAQLADLAAVKEAFNATVRKQVAVTAVSVDVLVAKIDSLGVPQAGVFGGGKPINGYQTSIYPPVIAADINRLAPTIGLRPFTDQMYAVASAYDSTADAALQGRLADLYVRLLDYFYDQGWTDGSVQGTIHHLGYQNRGFYNSVWLMRDLLASRGRLVDVRATLHWMVGLGKFRVGTGDANLFYNGIFDIINTTLMGLLGSVLIADGETAQVANLSLLQNWFNNAIKPSPGIQGGFKPDFATFHHMGHYPAYARDGLNGGSPALAVLAGTGFAISQESHERWNQALLAMRFYSNKTNFPLSLSNRHPTGTDSLSLNCYQTMTLAGSPDGKHELDPVIGAAFLRLLPAKPFSAQLAVAKQLAAAGVVAEPDPSGCQVMNHAALVSHRRDNWLVSVRGHNRYLWSTEMYGGSNEYGRYITYGHVQVMSGGDPVSNTDSGFVQPGWDWNRFPGTTAIQLPFEQLNTTINPLGEEMLLTDQRLGGGGTIGGKNGAFLMSLHESAVYDGSFHARKSVFMFDNRVVALGSGIENHDRKHSTQTTLFQCHLANTSVPTQDSRVGAIASVPYNNTEKLHHDPVWLVDPQNVGYYVPGGQQLVVSRAVQTAPDQGAKTEGTLPYATAVIDHGNKPKRGTYEYSMVVGATAESMASFTADMGQRDKAAYKVLRHDDTAHVVQDRATGITAHAVFEAAKKLTDGVVKAVDTPSVVLVQPDGAELVLSVTDPDLRFYNGKDKSDPAQSPFGVPWRGSPSQGSKITVELEGRWKSGTDGVKANVGHNTTQITVNCADGLPTELRLTKA
ncbi:chondroitinase family polysaccharide lyase [Arthrobacter sp. H35-D1]|uniref:chondroitinase family polysaccharide lyase n=1 Tax=Arthrobacter sp. H35-D1 TaxID=3046202 RepID=UPI0024B9AE6F|nr:chondroitinase family polysaccharide lyase [Arthrobacter sp. H35-D1]MDJ0314461.1 chondroitinase family polysaccharide lyase [Arthrobacter sp. H35-D1]